MATTDTVDPGQYWDGWDHDVVSILEAVRRFRRHDQEMRRRISAEMDMNESDLQALQFVIAAQSRGEQVSPRGLATYLAISTASTTKLLDRLTTSGHLERRPHPTDRRALLLRATDHAHHEVRALLADMHERMAQIARAVPPDSRQAVIDFLDGLSTYLEEVAVPGPLTPDGDEQRR